VAERAELEGTGESRGPHFSPSESNFLFAILASPVVFSLSPIRSYLNPSAASPARRTAATPCLHDARLLPRSHGTAILAASNRYSGNNFVFIQKVVF